jgi:hypothetical protein
MAEVTEEDRKAFYAHQYEKIISSYRTEDERRRLIILAEAKNKIDYLHGESLEEAYASVYDDEDRTEEVINRENELAFNEAEKIYEAALRDVNIDDAKRGLVNRFSGLKNEEELKLIEAVYDAHKECVITSVTKDKPVYAKEDFISAEQALSDYYSKRDQALHLPGQKDFEAKETEQARPVNDWPIGVVLPASFSEKTSLAEAAKPAVSATVQPAINASDDWKTGRTGLSGLSDEQRQNAQAAFKEEQKKYPGFRGLQIDSFVELNQHRDANPHVGITEREDGMTVFVKSSDGHEVHFTRNDYKYDNGAEKTVYEVRVSRGLGDCHTSTITKKQFDEAVSAGKLVGKGEASQGKADALVETAKIIVEPDRQKEIERIAAGLKHPWMRMKPESERLPPEMDISPHDEAREQLTGELTAHGKQDQTKNGEFQLPAADSTSAAVSQTGAAKTSGFGPQMIDSVAKMKAAEMRAKMEASYAESQKPRTQRPGR